MFAISSHAARRTKRSVVGVAAAAALAIMVAGCTPAPTENPGSTDPLGVDNGTNLTMWSRSATETQSQAFVDAYNASHENQVELTIIPNDDFVTKVGAAAGGGGLPDLISADIVFVPNWTSQGLFLDITDRIDSLPFVDTIAPSHIEAGTWEGAKYIVPHTMDLSVLFYNKDLYEQAGLDPEAPPTTLKEFDEQARAIAEVPGDHNGTFFGGDCGGCLVFTWWPSIWADGGEPLSADGRTAQLNSPEAKAVFEIYRGLVTDGIVYTGTDTEKGPTWVQPFGDGKVGIMPMPSTMLGSMPETTGVAAIPGVDGNGSTFVGGDGLGISGTSKNADAAWNFVAWSLSDEAQVEVLAKGGNVVARTDLATNKYSEADPRVVMINEIAASGHTPFSTNFNAAFNAPGSPWLTLLRNQVFGDPSTLDADNDAVTKELDQ